MSRQPAPHVPLKRELWMLIPLIGTTLAAWLFMSGTAAGELAVIIGALSYALGAFVYSRTNR